MVRWTASPFAALIDVVGLQEIELALIIHIIQLIILYLHPKCKNKPHLSIPCSQNVAAETSCQFYYYRIMNLLILQCESLTP